jgi:hypothetical protein
MNQIEKKQYIPNVLALFFSVAMFLFMMIPHSQYELLNEMSQIELPTNNANALCVVVSAVMTVFVIIFLVFVAAMSLLSLFTSFLYNFHFVSFCLMITCILTAVLQSVYFFVGLHGILSTGEAIVGPGNYVIYAFCLACVIAYIYLYFRLIDKPYKEIKHQAKEHIAEYKDVENIVPDDVDDTPKAAEKQEDTKKEDSDSLSLSVLNLLQKGKITSEEAKKLLDEINSEKKD